MTHQLRTQKYNNNHDAGGRFSSGNGAADEHQNGLLPGFKKTGESSDGTATYVGSFQKAQHISNMVNHLTTQGYSLEHKGANMEFTHHDGQKVHVQNFPPSSSNPKDVFSGYHTVVTYKPSPSAQAQANLDHWNSTLKPNAEIMYGTGHPKIAAKQKMLEAAVARHTQKEDRGSQDEEKTMKLDFSKVFKTNAAQKATNMPAGTEGENKQPAVTGPRSGESQGTSANRGSDGTAAPKAPSPEAPAGGPRSGENKALPDNGTAPSGSVTGPRSGENVGTPAVAQDNDPLKAAAAPTSHVAGMRSGENKGTPHDALPAGTSPTADGPRSGDNEGTNDANETGEVSLTQGPKGESGSSQEQGGVKAPAALSADALRRGTKVRMRSGVVAKLEDNKKGNTRLATVYGTQRTAMGSVNVNDMTHYKTAKGDWQKIAAPGPKGLPRNMR